MTTKQVFGYTETDSTERFNSKSRLALLHHALSGLK